MIYIETPSPHLSSHRSDLWATQEPCGDVASFIPSAPVTFHFQTRADIHTSTPASQSSHLTLSKVWVPRDTPGTLRARVPTTVRMARAMGSSEWTQLPVQAPTGLRTQPFQMGKGAW